MRTLVSSGTQATFAKTSGMAVVRLSKPTDLLLLVSGRMACFRKLKTNLKISTPIKTRTKRIKKLMPNSSHNLMIPMSRIATATGK